MPALRAKDFTPGVPMELTLKSTSSKNVESRITNEMQGMFSTSIGALYLDGEVATDVETQIRDMGIRVGEPIRIIKIRTTHGGHRWVVQRPPEMVDQLQASVRARVSNGNLRNANGSARALTDEEMVDVGLRPASAQSHVPAGTTGNNSNVNSSPTPNGSANGAPPPAALGPQAACMRASLCSAVDAIIETQAYATRKGLGLTFSEESVRAIGLSIYIDACRNGGGR